MPIRAEGSEHPGLGRERRRAVCVHVRVGRAERKVHVARVLVRRIRGPVRRRHGGGNGGRKPYDTALCAAGFKRVRQQLRAGGRVRVCALGREVRCLTSLRTEEPPSALSSSESAKKSARIKLLPSLAGRSAANAETAGVVPWLLAGFSSQKPPPCKL